jgi:phosphatidylglycerophosphate synthase
VRTVQRAPVTGVVLLVAVLTVVQATVGLGAVGWTVGLLASATAAGLLAVALHRTRTTRFGPANVVTLVRATLGQAVAALVAASFVDVDHRGLLLGLTAVALALDAVDGRVARRTHSVTPLGARFDMEADAFLILVLSIAAGPVVGWWVLTIGFARYALLLAERGWPWLRVRVPRRYWRKVVAAVQGVTLAVVVAGLLPTVEAVALLLVALGLLAESFGRDVVWLVRRGTVPTRRSLAPSPSAAVPTAAHLARITGG